MSALLSIDDIHVSYGNITALRGVSLQIHTGEIVTLIGANGAGKSTTLRAIMGLNPLKKGSISYEGRDLSKLKTHERVRSNLILSPEGRQVFANLTVAENLAIGAFSRKDHDGIKHDLEQVYAYFPRLKERADQLGGTLSGGEQQMLAMGRALMGRPKMLLLDEPSMGLAPIIIKQIFEMIKKVREGGVTVLLVEQNAHAALGIADRAYVLETGVVTLSGSAAELANAPQVREAYLGL